MGIYAEGFDYCACVGTAATGDMLAGDSLPK